MKILDTASTDPNELSSFEKAALYNGMDVFVTLGVYNKISSALDQSSTAQTYAKALALQGPVLEMMHNGVLVDIQARQELIDELTAKIVQLNTQLDSFANALGFADYFINHAAAKLSAALESSGLAPSLIDFAHDKTERRLRTQIRNACRAELKFFDETLKAFSLPFNGRSVKQKCQLLYDMTEYGGLPGPVGLKPVVRRSKLTSLVRPVADREAMELILSLAEGKTARSKYYWMQPIITTILAMMDLAKERDFLKAELSAAGRFHCSFGIAGTNTGRFNSGKNPFALGANFQNYPEPLRKIFIAGPNAKLSYIDLEQAESRVVGAICYALFGSTNYLDACESGDLHSLVCSMIWPRLAWPRDFSLDALREHGPFPPDLVRAAKQIANQNFYRNFSFRDMAKRGGHASNYYGKPPQISRHLHVETKLIASFQSGYFEAFPELPRWHRKVAETLQISRTITSLMSRKRIFFGRPYEDETLRKAIAYNPQSSVADYLSQGIMNLWHAITHKELPIKLFGQVHDAVAFEYPEAQEKETLKISSHLLEPKIQIHSPSGTKRDFSIPNEIAVGWNLSYRKPTNPDGLIKFWGEDERIRTKRASVGLLDRVLY